MEIYAFTYLITAAWAHVVCVLCFYFGSVAELRDAPGCFHSSCSGTPAYTVCTCAACASVSRWHHAVWQLSFPSFRGSGFFWTLTSENWNVPEEENRWKEQEEKDNYVQFVLDTRQSGTVPEATTAICWGHASHRERHEILVNTLPVI